MENQRTFRIGLSMAGAISAGAYTAGVMDYLLEALENWQEAKNLGLPGVPKHEVVLEVMSGASAGGMTAVVTAAAIQKHFPPVHQQNYSGDAAHQNPLFDAWVNLTEKPGRDMMNQLLDLGDISGSPDLNPNKEVRSVFNSFFIGEIAGRVIDTTVKDPRVKRAYIADNLELVTTLTNLRGFNYDLEFITEAGKREDRMTMHKDLLHFQWSASGQYQQDGKIPFHFDTPDGLNKKLLADAAIATGAFPVGLAPKILTRDPKYINDNPLLKITHGNEHVVNPIADYTAVCVDGGVINNEPYDLTEILLVNRSSASLRDAAEREASPPRGLVKSASEFDTAIILIAPFPNFEDQPAANYFCLQSLKTTAGQLFKAMRQQLMLKSDMLERAYDDNDCTRFMVAPVRTKNGVTQKNGIACGSVGGFGGFFSRKFRIHDYMLGRRNCQRFIQEFFCVPVSACNPIIGYGYGNLTPAECCLLQTKSAHAFPILPDIRINRQRDCIRRPKVEEEFDYPSIGIKYLVGLEKKIRIRFGAVLDNFNRNAEPGKFISQNPLMVRKIRKRSMFRQKIVRPIESILSRGFFAIGKRVARNIAAERFLDAVISDMDQKGLLMK